MNTLFFVILTGLSWFGYASQTVLFYSILKDYAIHREERSEIVSVARACTTKVIARAKNSMSGQIFPTYIVNGMECAVISYEYSSGAHQVSVRVKNNDIDSYDFYVVEE